jgi:Tol biopolymer transport system component
LHALDATAASGAGWSVQTSTGFVAATGASLVNGVLKLTFGSALHVGSTLYYGYGVGRIVAADGSGGPVQLTDGDFEDEGPAWSPDGKTLAYAETAGGPTDSPTGWDIWLWRAGSPPTRTTLVQTTFNEDQPMFSPGGRLLAYVSDETERREVYLRAFPDSGRRVRVSADGGTEPVWSRRGDELFYRSGRRYYAVRMTGADLTVPGPPTLMFEHDPVVTSVVPGAPAYDVAPDGKRFIMLTPADDSPGLTRLDVALGWTRELDRRLQPPAVR